MNLNLKRITRTNQSTIGELSLDGVFFCYTQEDTDRGLKQSESLQQLADRKVFSQTAIPSGKAADEQLLRPIRRVERIEKTWITIT